MEQLSLKYRPQTFDDLIGQRVVQEVLRRMVAKRRVPPALLFAGCRGSGKTTSLRVLAAALNCDDPPVPCGHCPSCKSVFTGTSMDLIEIDAASHGLVDDIRQLREHLMCSTGGRWRIVGLDEAHSMSAAAFNALLKILEEPPPYTVFVLLTTEPGRIPDTVSSRCNPFTFHRLTIADITTRLVQICAAEQFDVEPALLHQIADRADGAMRNAVMLLDQFTRVGITTLAEFTALMGDPDPGPAILDTLRHGNLAATYAAVTAALNQGAEPHTIVAALSGTLRDLCILRSGGDLPVHGSALAARQQLTAALPAATVTAAMRLLWEYTTKIRPGGDPRTGLDLVIAMLAEAFTPTPPPPATPTTGKATLAELAAMRR